LEKSKWELHMRRHMLLVTAAVSLLSATPAIAGGISVPMDEARVVTFAKPVTSVYVANPFVADVNSIDATHALVLGKAFGATNLIGLDSHGNQVVSEHVSVFGSSHLVTLNRGSNQYTFACATARCETAPAPGDVRTWHDDGLAEVEKREDLGAKQAMPNEGH
jgi:putative type II/III system pilus formation protein